MPMSTPFLRVKPWNFPHTSWISPAEPLTNAFYIYFFSPDIWAFVFFGIFESYGTSHFRRKKKKNIRKRLGRDTLKTCAKFQDILLSKTAWTLDSEGIGGIMLEPACTRYPWRFWAWQRVYLSMIRFSTWRPRMAASVIKVDIYPVLV